MNKRTAIDETLTTSKDPRCYTINTHCSQELITAIYRVQNKFIERFGDRVFCARGADLHATLIDWFNPFVTYEKDVDVLFLEIRNSWEKLTRKVLGAFPQVEVYFDTLEYRHNCICLAGQDNGQFNLMRDALQAKGFLPIINKRPPSDIHITIITFREELDEEEVLELLAGEEFSIHEIVQSFRLVHAPKARLQEHSEITELELEGNSASPL